MSHNSATRTKRVLVIASGGGHWVQLRRLRPAWQGCAVTYVTTKAGYREEVMADPREAGARPPRFHVIPDANRWQKLRLLRQLATILWIMARVRPQAVVTTGAAPGYFAIRAARLLRAKTVWVDSIANAEELSLSGRKAGPHADLWLTQWPGLAAPEGEPGPRYRGAVL
ncbi:MAG: PssD/Cps14F family polysaccharide biosynthesis glycosyltransferase [Rhodospirillales bacterium]